MGLIVGIPFPTIIVCPRNSVQLSNCLGMSVAEHKYGSAIVASGRPFRGLTAGTRRIIRINGGIPTGVRVAIRHGDHVRRCDNVTFSGLTVPWLGAIGNNIGSKALIRETEFGNAAPIIVPVTETRGRRDACRDGIVWRAIGPVEARLLCRAIEDVEIAGDIGEEAGRVNDLA